MDTTEVKYPDVTVELIGQDGNALAIVDRVSAAIRRHLRETAPEMTAAERQAEVNAFVAEATSGDYDHVLQTCMRWVEVE